MERDLMDRLVDWKASPARKPLIVNGARQVGKTWLLREFGRRHYGNVAYVSFDNDSLAQSLFERDYNIERIISELSLHLDMDILPGGTLIVFDEVQACPKAITSLKYFCENAPQYHIAAAGSLLGISAHEGTGYPVGKVNTLDLMPLTFSEFLHAQDKSRLAAVLASGDRETIAAFSEKFESELKSYYVVGGMPEVVKGFVQTGDYAMVRATQAQILQDYARDFSKHVPTRLLSRTSLAWESIPRHLSNENKKFVFGQVRQGARAADFEEALVWLEQAGLIHRIFRVMKSGMPLASYSDGKAFKVFMLDTGLLGSMCDLDPVAVLEGNRVFTEFKGALTEQYVCQELIASCGVRPFYWSADSSRGEIDFLVQRQGRVYPIEVKAEENLRAKSLAAFNQRYEGMHARRFSMSGFRDERWMRNVPLYAVGNATLWG